MPDNANSLGQVAGQLQQFLRELTLKQKLLMLGAAALVVGMLFFFVRLTAKPPMKPLISGMDAQEAQALSTRLTGKKIRNEVSAEGTSVLVASDRLDEARLEIASQGMPRSGRMGFELFDKPNWAGSDFSEKVNYQRALEGELERTIQTLRSVEAVRVHLVMPQDSVFVDRETAAKATVVLKSRSRHIDPEEQRAIANLVAGAVDKLSPQNVSVIDADSDRPLTDGNDGEPFGEDKYEQKLAAGLTRTLEAVAGPGRVRASVHIERDITSGEETQESYDPNSTVTLTMQRTEERSGSATPSGIPGTASNVPGSAGEGLAKVSVADSALTSRSENGTYAVNRMVRHTVLPAGRIRKLTAAVLVDDVVETRSVNGKAAETRRKRTPEEVKQLEELAKASLGWDAVRGDLITVQSISFQSIPIESPKPPSAQQRVQIVVQQWSGLLRYAVLLLLFLTTYILFLRPVKKQLISSYREVSGRRVKGAISGTSVAAPGTLEGEAGVPESVRLKQRVLERVKAEPAATSRLLQSWLREGGAQ